MPLSTYIVQRPGSISLGMREHSLIDDFLDFVVLDDDTYKAILNVLKQINKELRR